MFSTIGEIVIRGLLRRFFFLKLDHLKFVFWILIFCSYFNFIQVTQENICCPLKKIKYICYLDLFFRETFVKLLLGGTENIQHNFLNTLWCDRPAPTTTPPPEGPQAWKEGFEWNFEFLRRCGCQGKNC